MGVIDTIFFGTDYCFIKFSQKTKQKMLTEMGVIDTIFFSSKSFFLDSSCPLATLNVTAQVDLIWELRDVHLEPVLDLVEDFCIALVRHKGDGETFGSKPSSPGHPVQVGVSVLGHVVVEDNVDSLNVHATTEEVGGDEDSLLESLELLVARESLLLSHASVNGDGWEILLYEELGQGNTSLHGLDEDDDLDRSMINAGIRNQNLILFIRGNAISAAPNIRGTNQLPNPPIKIGITIKKIIIKACAVTTTL